MANKTVIISPSGGDYTSLTSAIAGEISANPDLTSAGMDGILTFQIQGTWSSADTGYANLTGFTVDATHYIIIQTDTANRAGKSWSTSKYRASRNSWESSLNVAVRYTRVIGVQFSSTNDTGSAILGINANDTVIDSCYVQGYGEKDCITYAYHNGSLVNTIAVRTTGSGINLRNAGIVIVSNCVALNCGIGFRVGQWDAQRLRNCYAGGCTTDYNNPGTVVVWTTCYSEDETGTTTTAACSTTSGAYFTNVTAGSEDLTLQPQSVLIGAGTNLSADSYYAFNTDIDGETREGAWDVGADEWVRAFQPWVYGQPVLYSYTGATPSPRWVYGQPVSFYEYEAESGTTTQVDLQSIAVEQLALTQSVVQSLGLNESQAEALSITQSLVQTLELNQAQAEALPLSQVTIQQIPLQGVSVEQFEIAQVTESEGAITQIPLQSVLADALPFNQITIQQIPLQGVSVVSLPVAHAKPIPVQGATIEALTLSQLLAQIIPLQGIWVYVGMRGVREIPTSPYEGYPTNYKTANSPYTTVATTTATTNNPYTAGTSVYKQGSTPYGE